MEEYYSYMKILLEEISNHVNNVDKDFYSYDIINNTLTSFNTSQMSYMSGHDTLCFYGNNIQKCISDLKFKEAMIEELINEIDKNIKEDEKLVKKIMAGIRDENRIENYEKEKKNLEIKEKLKQQKIIRKIKQFTFKEKYKFKEPIPFHILKERRKKITNNMPQSTESSFLFY